MLCLPRLRSALLVLTMAAVSACGGADGGITSMAPAGTAGPANTAPAPTGLSPTSAVVGSAPGPASSPDETTSLPIPEGPAPRIDGVMAPGEWESATILPMSDGASLSMQHSGATLYLAVTGTEVGSVNVLMASTDQIWILHSSAALGSALYAPGPGRWELVHGFSWCCRSRTDDAARRALLEEEGWQANTGLTGDPGIVEYQIVVPWQGVSFAVSTIRSGDDMGFWPADLPAEARSQLVGAPPATRAYDFAQWSVIFPASD